MLDEALLPLSRWATKTTSESINGANQIVDRLCCMKG